MSTTYDLSRRRRPEKRHWIALAAAAAAVVVLVVLIAVACQARDGSDPALSGDPDPTGTATLGRADDDTSGGAAGDDLPGEPGGTDGGPGGSGSDGGGDDGGGSDGGDDGGGDDGGGDDGGGDDGGGGGAPLTGHELVVNDVTVPAGGFVRDTAVCPAGKVALAGGARVIGAGSADFETRLQESGPGTIGGGAQSLWLAAVSNGGAHERTVRISAVCADPPAGYQLVAEDLLVGGGGGFVREAVACPDGTVVLGGGATVIGAGTGDFKTRIQESIPGSAGGGPHSTWLLAISSTGAEDRTVRLRAVCADEPAGYDAATADHTLDPGGFARDAVGCPGGTLALGGGAAVIGAGSANFRTFVRESGIGSSGGAPSAWLVAIGNASGDERTVRLRALCAAVA